MGLVPWFVEKHTPRGVPVGEQEHWALALMSLEHTVGWSLPRRNVQLLRLQNITDTRCEPLELGPVGSDPALALVSTFESFLREDRDKNVTDDEEFLDSLVRPYLRFDSGAEHSTVWFELDQFLSDTESESLARSALGQTSLRNVAMFLHGRERYRSEARRHAYSIDWGYWTIPLMLKFGPGRIEQLAMDAYLEEVELDVFKAHDVLSLDQDQLPLPLRVLLV